MSDNLSEPIKQQVEQLRQPKRGNNFQPKFLLIILGIVLVILSIEGVLLTVMKNRNKSREAENTKKAEILQEKITPVPTGRIAESSWEGKKTSLIKGKVASFDINDRKINLTLEDNTIKTIDVDNKTIFMYLEVGEIQISPPQPKTIDISTFWKELKEGETISASCYDNGMAAFIINY